MPTTGDNYHNPGAIAAANRTRAWFPIIAHAVR